MDSESDKSCPTSSANVATDIASSDVSATEVEDSAAAPISWQFPPGGVESGKKGDTPLAGSDSDRTPKFSFTDALNADTTTLPKLPGKAPPLKMNPRSVSGTGTSADIGKSTWFKSDPSTPLSSFSSTAASPGIVFPKDSFNFKFSKGSIFQSSKKPDAKEPTKAAVPLSIKPVERSTGEEGEERIHSVRTKLFKMDDADKKWRERGVGHLHINFNSKTNTTRLVMRADGVYRLILNVALFPEMTIDRPQDKSILFVAYDDEGLGSFLLRVSRNDEATKLVQLLGEYKTKGLKKAPAELPSDAKPISFMQAVDAPPAAAAPSPAMDGATLKRPRDDPPKRTRDEAEKCKEGSLAAVAVGETKRARTITGEEQEAAPASETGSPRASGGAGSASEMAISDAAEKSEVSAVGGPPRAEEEVLRPGSTPTAAGGTGLDKEGSITFKFEAKPGGLFGGDSKTSGAKPSSKPVVVGDDISSAGSPIAAPRTRPPTPMTPTAKRMQAVIAKMTTEAPPGAARVEPDLAE